MRFHLPSQRWLQPNNSEVHLPTQVLGRTLSPLKSPFQSRGSEGTAEAVLRSLTRLATSKDPPHTAPQAWRDEPSHPWRAPRSASAWCTVHSVPSLMVSVQPGVITSRWPVHTMHSPESVEAALITPLRALPCQHLVSGGRLHTAHITAGDTLPSVTRCKRTTAVEAPGREGKGVHDYDAIPR